jgi:esterase/lipase superfamily enzyme/TRAP-type C4-dicarboxylate transport system substrate-binding protein
VANDRRGLLYLLASIAAALVSATLPSSSVAQQRSLKVMVDSGYQVRAQRFLDELSKKLEPEARAALKFEPYVVAGQKLPSSLRGSDWDLAILSTGAVTNATADLATRSSLTAFEMPFAFPNSQSAIALQQSPQGRAALGRIASSGVTGLVYLNSGMSLAVSSKPIKSPKDFNGMKFAVPSTASHQTLQALGGSPVRLPGGEIVPAMDRGVVDSALIESGTSNPWVVYENRYLLADGIKAQVAIVLTRNASWDEIPFVQRAMIGDAAIAASQQLDQEVVQAERLLFEKVRSSGLLVTLRKDDADRATREWIHKQPATLQRDIFSTYDLIKKPPPSGTSKPAIQQKGGQLGRIYFATTRDDTGSRDIRYRFGDARTNVVKCGELAYPQGSRKSNAIALVSPVTADSQTCSMQMSELLKASDRMLVFVHGFNNRFAEAAERAAMLKDALGPDTQVLLWSWPSKRDGAEGHYNYDKESVSGAARQSLSRLFRAMKPSADQKALSVLAHSMGSWHVLGALQDISQDPDKPKLRNIALAAPDVPVDEFNYAVADVRVLAERITLYACSSDRALQFSQLINAFRRAGTGGAANILVSSDLESVDVEGRLLSANHSYVFEAGKVLTDLTEMVVLQRDAEGRGLHKQPKPPWHYWKFL